jgi:hypothetical protein
LDIAEFSINIHVNASTGFSPFQTVYGFTPDTYGSLVLQTKQGPAYDWLKDRADIQKLVSTNLVEAKLFQEHYANRKVREAELHVGDRVAIRTEGLRLQGQPSSVLKQRYIGPFEVIEKLSPLVYKLKLPKAYTRIHPVFHISKLRLWRDDRKYPERFVSEALSEQHADIAQGETLVDSILDVKIAQHKSKPNGDLVLQFLVHWRGFDDTADSWEPYANIKDAQALDAFFVSAAWKTLQESQEYVEYCRHHRANVPKDQRPTKRQRKATS